MTGIICVNKPKDITSFGVCAKVRGITGEKKCGHTGTLDPMATGVLPIVLGGATRFLDYLPESDKRYRATFILGITTDTLDITGNVTERFEVNKGAEDILNILPKFRGKILQLPPMYSAISVDGNRLYDLARKGIEVEREKREVEIKELELISSNENEFTIDVLCTKGTYVRTLIDDIGRELKTGAVMTSLTRTMAMGFSLENSFTIEELQAMKDNATGFDTALLKIDKILSSYKEISVTAPQANRFRNGGALDLDRLKYSNLEKEYYRVYSPEKEFLGLGEPNFEKNSLIAKRIFVNR